MWLDHGAAWVQISADQTSHLPAPQFPQAGTHLRNRSWWTEGPAQGSSESSRLGGDRPSCGVLAGPLLPEECVLSGLHQGWPGWGSSARWTLERTFGMFFTREECSHCNGLGCSVGQ